jgi:hypothetical protein
MLGYDSIDLLPDLEEDVFFDDSTIVDIEESFLSGIDDWWGGFVADMYL